MNTELQELFNEYKSLCPENDNLYKITLENIDDDIKDSVKWTLLMGASYNGLDNIVKKCISLGTDVNRVNQFGTTALFLAMYSHEITTIKILLEAGANPNIKINFINNTIPVIFLFNWFTDDSIYIDIAKMLINYGAKLNEFYKYKDIYKDKYSFHMIKFFKPLVIKHRWAMIKCVIKLLSVHKRAVITANHPDRLLEQGVFELEI
jgi:ankyrin repeat protein